MGHGSPRRVAIEGVSGIAHHFAGLRDIAKLPPEFENAKPRLIGGRRFGLAVTGRRVTLVHVFSAEFQNSQLELNAGSASALALPAEGVVRIKSAT